MSSPPRMPTLYIPHGGGPCFFMDWNPPDEWDQLEAFLRGISATLPQTPKAILMISAHWLSQDVALGSGKSPDLIFDYYGFPDHTYRLEYPAPGSPELAARAGQLLRAQGIASEADAGRGFDHGMFIPLLLMFPEARIPVVQMSLLDSLDPQAHLDAGRALEPLRDEGVLIVGSGMSFHNMRGYRDPRFAPISDEFDAWLDQAVSAPPRERDALLAQWAVAPAARLCHPPGAEEHLLPLMVAAGAAGNDYGRTVFKNRVMQTTVSGVRFG